MPFLEIRQSRKSLAKYFNLTSNKGSSVDEYSTDLLVIVLKKLYISTNHTYNHTDILMFVHKTSKAIKCSLHATSLLNHYY